MKACVSFKGEKLHKPLIHVLFSLGLSALKQNSAISDLLQSMPQAFSHIPLHKNQFHQDQYPD